MKKYIKRFCSIVCFFCVLYTLWWWYGTYQHEQDIRVLLEQKQRESYVSVAEIVQRETEKALEIERARLAAEEAEKVEENSREEAPAILLSYQKLSVQNPDMVGWLTIPGMGIDYPVMQGEDDEFYLVHNFDKKEDKRGSLFMKSTSDSNAENTNMTVYGHNMKDGSMFGNLDEYRSEAFMQQHRTIQYDTLYENRTYEVLAVFLSQVYRENEDVFKYYQFYQAENEKQFLEYYENIKKLSLYDTGVTAEYTDSFLTLSTCTYHVDYGRLVVVAKRIT